MSRMPDPYPNELRHRIIKRIETVGNIAFAAREFRVSYYYAFRIWGIYRKTGCKDLVPQSHHGPLGSVTPPLKKKIVLTMRKRPQTTIAEIQDMLQRHGVKLGYSRVHQVLEMLGCTGAGRKAMLDAWNAKSNHKKGGGKKARSRTGAGI